MNIGGVEISQHGNGTVEHCSTEWTAKTGHLTHTIFNESGLSGALGKAFFYSNNRSIRVKDSVSACERRRRCVCVRVCVCVCACRCVCAPNSAARCKCIGTEQGGAGLDDQAWPTWTMCSGEKRKMSYRSWSAEPEGTSGARR